MENTEIVQKKFSIIQEISRAMVLTDNINAVADLMLDLAVNYAGAEKGSLMLVNEYGGLSILAARGLDINLCSASGEKIGEGIAGSVAATKYPVIVEDIDAHEDFRMKKRDHYKTNSFISCPVVCKNRLLGVLNINDKRDGLPFTEDEFSMIKVIANQAAISLDNAYLMNKLRKKAAELEHMNRRLLESNVMKTDFITRIAHELRTPLNSIKGSIYYLEQKEKLPRSSQKKFFTIISRETAALTNSVEKLLNFLRIEESPLDH